MFAVQISGRYHRRWILAVRFHSRGCFTAVATLNMFRTPSLTICSIKIFYNNANDLLGLMTSLSTQMQFMFKNAHYLKGYRRVWGTGVTAPNYTMHILSAKTPIMTACFPRLRFQCCRFSHATMSRHVYSQPAHADESCALRRDSSLTQSVRSAPFSSCIARNLSMYSPGATTTHTPPRNTFAHQTRNARGSRRHLTSYSSFPCLPRRRNLCALQTPPTPNTTPYTAVFASSAVPRLSYGSCALFAPLGPM